MYIEKQHAPNQDCTELWTEISRHWWDVDSEKFLPAIEICGRFRSASNLIPKRGVVGSELYPELLCQVSDDDSAHEAQ